MGSSTGQRLRNGWLLSVVVFCSSSTLVLAHHPERETQTPHPRIDLIGPLGNRFPPSYRRVYNRPTYWGGKIAYWIAPSSQEAMAWHRAQHIGAYKKHLPRIENAYFYPKPWEAMRTGQRVSVLDPPQPADHSRNLETALEAEDSPEITEPAPTQLQTQDTGELGTGELGTGELDPSELPINPFEVETGEK